ncbi:CsbD family protein [Enterovirga rhinocerotis]|uniref:Uncharacterized protein YjbJ (UPF0337 family) n=1 Tax=Enterovirga rhinocerotis TaxID=1339210 RepID=A0A4R7C4I3_9HYPH|nr:CsbD family protein [Enterovirga rhinocerotis]TDR93450.1 uncharacterized protein YjbJ (UPF0337 family) [Enterovirga rhinocerotis]
MDSDRIAGAARNIGGKVERRVGELAGNSRLEAEGLVDQAKGAVQNAYGQAKDTAREYVDRAKDQAGDYADQARDVADRVVDEGRRYIDEGRRYVDDGLERYQDAAGRSLREGREAVSRQVEQSPLAAMLIAGAVGYALALLIHSRR